ncbi:MAG: protein kinase [Polyangiaceae bacterium]
MARLDGPTALSQGDILGTYQLLMPVGAGGMGRVWAARRLNSPTTQFVAVKTALEELSGDEEFERVFVDEARIASSIVHPNVCTIYEMGSEGSIPYLVMEWVNGGSLHDILSATPGRRIDMFLAVRIVASVCAGLHAAHELRDLDGTPIHVVHRDVSPQNILISEHGHVKIADFGVARAKGQLHRPTVTGEFKGKLSYMAPEQLTTKNFDRRADIFALGCVLYQATTGQRPFHGGDALETMYKLLETECEPPSKLVESYPPDLEAIVLKALSKQVETRYQTAEELEHVLERYLTSTNRLVTDRDVAQLVVGTLGPIISRRSEDLKAALTQTEAKPAARRQNAGPAPASSSTAQGQPASSSGKRKHSPSQVHTTSRTHPSNDVEDHDPSARADQAADGSAVQHSLEAVVEPVTALNDPALTPGGAWESRRPDSRPNNTASRARFWSTLAGLSVLVFALTAGISRLTRKSPTTASTRPNDVSAENRSHIEVRIRTQPADAHIEFDGERTATGLLVLSIEPSSRTHEISANLSGYAPVRRQLVLDHSTDVLLELLPVGGTTSEAAAPRTMESAPTGSEKASSTAPRAQSAQRQLQRASPAVSAKPSDVPPTKTKKPKRSLDPNNPFSEP